MFLAILTFLGAAAGLIVAMAVTAANKAKATARTVATRAVSKTAVAVSRVQDAAQPQARKAFKADIVSAWREGYNLGRHNPLKP